MNETTITLTLSIQEANAVLAGIQELPAKIANPLTEKIRQQASAQLPQPSQESAE